MRGYRKVQPKSVWIATLAGRRAEITDTILKTTQSVNSASLFLLLPSTRAGQYKGKPTLLKWLTGSARTFRGSVVLGIRDVSRTLEFRASYTLVEHAPADSMELEIKPYALAEIEKVRAAFEGRQ